MAAAHLVFSVLLLLTGVQPLYLCIYIKVAFITHLGATHGWVLFSAALCCMLWVCPYVLQALYTMLGQVHLLCLTDFYNYKTYVLSNLESVQCNFFIFDHVTFIQFKICCCVQNFIEIG